MAKQNVSLIERHLEKLVIAVAGGVLLVVVILYLMIPPHKVNLGGQNVGPTALYERIRAEADSTRDKLRRASWIAPDEVDAGIPQSVSVDMPTEFGVVFVPPNLKVPEVQGFGPRGKLKLARVLPPSKPLLTGGRAFVQLPEPVDMSPGARDVSPAPEYIVTHDHHWLTVVAGMSREAQREVFLKADYGFDEQELIVAAVEAERQMRLPDGRWTAGEIIRGYASTRLVGQATMPLDEERGVLFVSDTNRAYIAEYLRRLDSSEAQAEIVRFPFQSLLSKSELWWQVPSEIPGFEFSWGDFQVKRPVETTESGRPGGVGRREGDRRMPGGRGERGSGSGRGTRGRPLDGRMQAMEDLKAAVEAYENGEYEEAEQLVKAVLSNKDAMPKDLDAARDMLPDLTQKLELARIQQTRIAKDTVGKRLGPDTEPIWMTDTTVQPGKTYRYRLRLVAFNPYAGVMRKLDNPEDAGRVLVQGDWSDWSEAKTVRPDKYLFFMGTAKGSDAAKVEIRQLINGVWRRASGEVTVGQPLSLEAGRNRLDYEALVVRIDDGLPYEQRVVDRNSRVAYQSKRSDILKLVNSQGEVEERIAAEDVSLRKKVIRELSAEEERASGRTDDPGRSPRGRRRPERSVGR